VNEHVDEEIGALLDGRLDERRRSELLARLATADEDYDVFADTASVLQEAEGGALEKAPEPDRQEEEAPRSTPVIPLRARHAAGWRSPAVRWMTLAAGVAALALVPVVRAGMSDDRWRDPERLVGLATQPGERIPVAWTHGWSRTRGGGSTAGNTQAAVRVGALHVDLLVAARAADPIDTTVVQLAREMVATLEGLDEPGSGLVVAEYRAIADSALTSQPRVLERLSDAHADVLNVVDPDYFAAGAWTEAARLAAKRKDAAFFSAQESRKALSHLVTLDGVTDSTRRALFPIFAWRDQKGTPDWDSLQRGLETLLQELAR